MTFRQLFESQDEPIYKIIDDNSISVSYANRGFVPKTLTSLNIGNTHHLQKKQRTCLDNLFADEDSNSNDNNPVLFATILDSLFSNENEVEKKDEPQKNGVKPTSKPKKIKTTKIEVSPIIENEEELFVEQVQVSEPSSSYSTEASQVETFDLSPPSSPKKKNNVQKRKRPSNSKSSKVKKNMDDSI